ncbi:hypothetical protein [Streptomyces sp. JJ38]|uniref:hypothetical protein n=1 Tax=Streptomyces sp. JJ38 TaxID=2738128 RepID=UPI001C55B171|nr:hypothetical protein [Streptomyces sp. JJ38]MBW1598590.1 hypothetical protein [Streptomyces sp. JJ38]
MTPGSRRRAAHIHLPSGGNAVSAASARCMARAQADDDARAELLTALRPRLVYEDGDRTVRVSAEVLHGLPAHGGLTR